MSSEPTHILLVDDLPENLLALEALLRDPGYVIHQATSGEQALELLLSHDFAIAILDVQMPYMNGFELAELMRGMERTRHVPIVFVTAAGKELDYSFKGYDTGAVDVLYKPLDPLAVKSKVAVFADLFRQRKAAQEQLRLLEETRAQLQQALHMRDEFMSVVAHELRTPLNTLALTCQVRLHRLEKADQQPPGEQALRKMAESDLRQVANMTRLIEDMLDVSRIDHGKLSIRPQSTDLSALLDRLVQGFPKPPGVILRADIAPDIRVSGDAFRIEQIAANLLTNAVRYGEGKPIDLLLHAQGGKAILTVRDQGVGIPKDAQARIFDRFVRVTDARTTTGLGLGLFITRQLVEAHRGTIEVESEPGHGSTFTVKLPLEGEAMR